MLECSDGFAELAGTGAQFLRIGFRRVQVLGQGEGGLVVRDAGGNGLHQFNNPRVIGGVRQISRGERLRTERGNFAGELGEGVQGRPLLIIVVPQLLEHRLPFSQFTLLLELLLLLGRLSSGAKQAFLHLSLPPAETERVEPPLLQVGDLIFDLLQKMCDILQ